MREKRPHSVGPFQSHCRALIGALAISVLTCHCVQLIIYDTIATKIFTEIQEPHTASLIVSEFTGRRIGGGGAHDHHCADALHNYKHSNNKYGPEMLLGNEVTMDKEYLSMRMSVR